MRMFWDDEDVGDGCMLAIGVLTVIEIALAILAIIAVL